MKITFEVELTERQATYLCNHSIERALNLAIAVADAWGVENPTEYPQQEFQVVVDDLTDIKPIATRLWVAAHNAIFAASNPG